MDQLSRCILQINKITVEFNLGWFLHIFQVLEFTKVRKRERERNKGKERERNEGQGRERERDMDQERE